MFVRKEAPIIGSYASSGTSVERLVALAASGVLDLARSITHVFSLDQADEALRVLHSRDGDPLRVVVRPDCEHSTEAVAARSRGRPFAFNAPATPERPGQPRLRRAVAAAWQWAAPPDACRPVQMLVLLVRHGAEAGSLRHPAESLGVV